MAKTIEELAKLASKNYNGEEFEKDIYGDGYKNGANAVLEEIENVLQYNKGDDRPWLLRGNHLFNELQKKIKSLKIE